MEQQQKFDMLSVVAFGIHTEVRERLQRAIESSAAHPRLHRILRPIFFYEYFFNTPVLRGEDGSEVVAFAPFLPRLVVEREFMAIPPNGFSTTGTEHREASGWEGVRMVPTTKDNVSEHWPNHVDFKHAVNESLILRLLHRGWNRVESTRLEFETDDPIGRALEEFRSSLDEKEARPFTEITPETFNYNQGVVSLAAGFSHYFAKKNYEAWCKTYNKESRESWHREYLACIYPWLLSSQPPKDPGGKEDRLFEILACSISSRSLLFGQLILFIPPIEDTECRVWAYKLLQSVLHEAVEDFYVPMLTLYENYQGEYDVEKVLEDVSTKPASDLNAWQEYPAFNKDRWAFITESLANIGSKGIVSSVLMPWPEPVGHEDSDPACNPLLKLARFIPLSTRVLRLQLQSLGTALRQGGTDLSKAIEAAKKSTQLLHEELDKPDEEDDLFPWAKALRAQLDSIMSLLDHPRTIDARIVSDVQMKLGLVDRHFAGVLSDLELNLAQLWADRIAWMHRNPKAVLESLVFSKYLIASPGMVNCIKSAMNIRHTRETRAVKTALIVGGAGSGKDSMARLVQVFSPGYRFGTRTVLNMAMFRPKEVAVPFLLGLDVRWQVNRAIRTGDFTSMGLTGIFQQALSRVTEVGQVSPPNRSPNSKHATREEGGTSSDRGFTFILDELNSLDIDSQGALLRMLENAELQALGSITPIDLDCLVVSVMNEDPELIMKKQALDSLLRDESLFGGIVGETLYELLRGQRRLRDDLYFRLARGGEIRIPELRQRREDIPILTYFIMREYIRTMPEISVPEAWDVELSAYEVLMRPALLWRGNIRELQAVCRQMLDLALAHHKVTGSPKLEILAKHAEEALARLSGETGHQSSLNRKKWQ